MDRHNPHGHPEHWTSHSALESHNRKSKLCLIALMTVLYRTNDTEKKVNFKIQHKVDTTGLSSPTSTQPQSVIKHLNIQFQILIDFIHG